jgi:excisionase family DNA binding protein
LFEVRGTLLKNRVCEGEARGAFVVDAQWKSMKANQSETLSTVPMTAILPTFLTAEETAALLRTSRVAIYAMMARGQLPGVTRIGRRVLVRTADLLDWLNQNRAPSPKE